MSPPSPTARLAATALAAAWIAAMAQLAIPVGEVPVTLQTFGVALVALTLGGRDGALAVLVYLALGAAGLPVFAAGAAGAQVLTGPTGGFLIGFVGQAAVTGTLRERGGPVGLAGGFGCCLAGSVVTHACGFAGLVVLGGFAPGKAWMIQAPFLPWDLVKAGAAALVYLRVRGALPPPWRG